MNTVRGVVAACREDTVCKVGGIGVALYGAWIAAGAGVKWLAGGGAAAAAPAALPVVASAGPKLANLANQFGGTAADIQRNVLTHGQRWVDNANAGNVNYLLQRPDGAAGFIRVTLDPNSQRVISAGLMRANQVANAIASGRFTQ